MKSVAPVCQFFNRWKAGGRDLFVALMNVFTPHNKVAYMLCLAAGLEMLHGGIIRQANFRLPPLSGCPVFN